MKKTILLLSAFITMSIFSFAQTTHEIEAGGGPNGPTPYYSPQFITIEVGDIVHWQSIGGTHNVDGRTATFPANPMSFFSGAAATGLNFSFTFTTAGFYEFECGAFDHALTQFGTITVVDNTTSLDELNAINVRFGPNPATEFINVSADEVLLHYVIMDVQGRIVMESSLDSGANYARIELNALDQGIYILSLETSAGNGIVRFRKD